MGNREALKIGKTENRKSGNRKSGRRDRGRKGRVRETTRRVGAGELAAGGRTLGGGERRGRRLGHPETMRRVATKSAAGASGRSSKFRSGETRKRIAADFSGRRGTHGVADAVALLVDGPVALALRRACSHALAWTRRISIRVARDLTVSRVAAFWSRRARSLTDRSSRFVVSRSLSTSAFGFPSC